MEQPSLTFLYWEVTTGAQTSGIVCGYDDTLEVI